MRRVNHITIRGGVDEVLALLAPVERWALLFRVYRHVRFIGRHERGTIIQIGAWRGPLPVHWTAEHIVFREEGRIVHRHLRGPTTGLWSEWRVLPAGERVQIVVNHDWHPGWPVIGPPLADFIGRLIFVPIAARTLRELRREVESGRAAALCRLEAARQERPSPARRWHGV
jgi:hypothetical protein